MERTLAGNPAIARNLVRLFERRFDPDAVGPTRGAQRDAEKLVSQIRTDLDAVVSLDEDRILRGYLSVVEAILRTNYYQLSGQVAGGQRSGQIAGGQTQNGQPKSYVAFKLDPARLPDLPLPRPKFEVFVYSPRVEAVHLRMGYVARGGIRWSDRREDFRTEILGLMKAQNVKNTLIVPVEPKAVSSVRSFPTGRGKKCRPK